MPEEQRYHLVRFARYDLVLELDAPLGRRTDTSPHPRELSPRQLWQAIQAHAATGAVPYRLRFFWHRLLAWPFACFIFVALGTALGTVPTRAGRSGGYVMSLLAALAYYLFFAASQALGEAALLPPVVAAWLPNGLVGWLAAVAVRQAARGAWRWR